MTSPRETQSSLAGEVWRRLSHCLRLPLALSFALVAFARLGIAEAQIRMQDDEPTAPTPMPTAAPSTVPPAPPAVIDKPIPVDVSVIYPPEAQGKATVVLELVVASDGSVSEVAVVEGVAPFAEAATNAARRWRFEPARRDGVPVAVRLRFAVEYVPPEPEANPEPEPPAPAPTPNPDSEATPRKPNEPKAVDVLVLGERQEASQSLGQAEVRELPGAFGDAFRAIELLPGVTPIASGVPYFYVRGAPPGNVGYLFDGIPVPVLFHFAAGPAILHPAFVGQVDLYPGGYPARYGRYAGGIVAGELAAPAERLRGEASVRLIDSGAMLETPFAEGRGNLMVGGRISYTGLIVSLLAPEVAVTYWDYQSRTRYELDEDDSLELLWFGSGDYLSAEQYDYETDQSKTETLVDMGFHRFDLRWDRTLSDGRLRHALMLGLDQTRVANGEVELSNYLLGARSEIERQLTPKHRLRAGADVLLQSLGQTFRNNSDDEDFASSGPPTPAAPSMPDPVPTPTPPGPERPPADMQVEPIPVEGTYQESYEPGDPEFDLGFGDRIDVVFGAHADVVMDVAPGVELTPGLRFDVFVSRNEVALGVDPRIAVRYRISQRLSLVHAFGLAHQMPSFAIPIPGITPSLKGGLQRSVQHSAGAELDLGDGYRSSFVVFHNLFFRMTDMIGVPEPDHVGFRALGQAYGFEAMLRRSLTKRLGGFASYTLSRSLRSIGRYRRGVSTIDRTHVFNAALSYDLGRNWRFGNRLLFYTGLPGRVDTGRAPEIDASLRTPPFWRLDWRLQKRWPNESGGHVSLIFEVLNTTLNKEVLQIECYDTGNRRECHEEVIGPVTIPSIGVEGAF